MKPDAFAIDDTPIDLGKIVTPLYVLGAENDHIAPWRATYLTTQHVGGDREVRADQLRAHRRNRESAGREEDLALQQAVGARAARAPTSGSRRADRHNGSWWQDWAEWAEAHGGAMREPYRVPEGEPAPGALRAQRDRRQPFASEQLEARS